MNVAISQTANSEDLAQQFDNCVSHLELAADQGADTVFFPELSLTGYNRALPPRLADPDMPAWIDHAIESFDAECRRLGVAALVGSVEFSPGYDKPLIRMVLLGEAERRTWYKSVLWNNEVKYFSAAAAADIYKDGLGVLICAEMDKRYRELGDDTVVVWPGIMSRAWADDPEAALFELIRSRNLCVYYANWPGAPNVPAHVNMKDGGQSCLIDASGIVMEAPRNTVGLLKCFDDGAFIAAQG